MRIYILVLLSYSVSFGATGRKAPYASFFYREQKEKTRSYFINSFDLYVYEGELEATPLAKLTQNKRCKPDPKFWTDANLSCKISSTEEIGVPSTLKKGSDLWLFAPDFQFKVKIESLKAVWVTDNTPHSGLEISIRSESFLPAYPDGWGLLFETEPPAQTHVESSLTKSAQKRLLEIAKKSGKVVKTRPPAFGPLIKTQLGNFTFVDIDIEEDGEFNTCNTLIFKEGEKNDWRVVDTYLDNCGTKVFGDVNGDGVPEISSWTGYRSVNIRTIHPTVKVFRSGTSGT